MNVTGVFVGGIEGDVETVRRFIIAAYGKVVSGRYEKKPVAQYILPVSVMHEGAGIFFQEKKDLVMGPVRRYAVNEPGVLKTVAADGCDIFNHK
jgi:hypothetical protein